MIETEKKEEDKGEKRFYLPPSAIEEPYRQDYENLKKRFVEARIIKTVFRPDRTPIILDSLLFCFCIFFIVFSIVGKNLPVLFYAASALCYAAFIALSIFAWGIVKQSVKSPRVDYGIYTNKRVLLAQFRSADQFCYFDGQDFYELLGAGGGIKRQPAVEDLAFRFDCALLYEGLRVHKTSKRMMFKVKTRDGMRIKLRTDLAYRPLFMTVRKKTDRRHPISGKLVYIDMQNDPLPLPKALQQAHSRYGACLPEEVPVVWLQDLNTRI